MVVMWMTPERFYRKARRVGDCLIWQGKGRINGYGVAGYGGEHWLAHRLSYVLAHGAIPGELQIRHSCDTRLCIEPRHLSVGTAKDNAGDKVSRGRHLRGDTHPMKKLNAEQVKEIRSRHKAGGVMQKELAEEYGVSKQQVSKIIRGARWASSELTHAAKGD